MSLLACLAGCGHSAAPTPPAASRKPNFVVIIADDMAYGLFGPGKRFPFLNLANLEALSSRAAFFDRAMVTTSLCSPSRATLLSGLYAHRHGVPGNESADIPPEIPTYPQILRASGYETAYVGKWHMDATTDMPRPGFDYWLSFRGQGVYVDPVLDENGKSFTRAGYITDILTEYAVNWIRRPHSKPFVLILGHKAPHEPSEPAPRHASALADVSLPEPATFDDSYASKPAWQRRYVRCGGGPTSFVRCPDPQPDSIPPWPWPPRDERRLDYLRSLLAVDESVGSVTAALASQDLTRNTYVVFLSDNGLFLGEHRLGDKRLAYEESLRVPFVVAGPDVSARRLGAMALNLDLAPTILDLAGVAVPTEMQGRSPRTPPARRIDRAARLLPLRIRHRGAVPRRSRHPRHPDPDRHIRHLSGPALRRRALRPHLRPRRDPQPRATAGMGAHARGHAAAARSPAHGDRRAVGRARAHHGRVCVASPGVFASIHIFFYLRLMNRPTPARHSLCDFTNDVAHRARRIFERRGPHADRRRV